MSTRRIILLAVAFFGSLVPSSVALRAQGGSAPASLDAVLQPAHIAGEVLVKFKDGASPSAVESYRVQFNARTLAQFRSGGQHWRLGPGHTEGEAIAALRQSGLVDYVEPNYTMSLTVAPDDPRYSELYGLHNTGQYGGTPGADIDAERAWGVSTGSPDVIVAVIDTGVDYTHADLSANMWSNPGEIPANGLDDDNNGFVDDVRGWDFSNGDNDPMDDHSHGTHVSGTIGATGNNGVGVVGVAWTIKILPLKFLGSDGSGTTSNAVRAVEYATAAGVDVMSNSWGGGGFSQALLDAIQAASDAGILFVAAAGNYGSDNDLYPFYPSNYESPNVVAVAATDRNDNLAYFSDYGLTTVDLGAPGVDTLSCIPGNGYGTKSGTSMATPHVSGVAALIRAVAPGIDVVHLKERLLAAVDPVPSLTGRTVTGGRLNAFLAIADPDAIPPRAVDDLRVAGATSNSLTVTWTAPGDDDVVGTAAAYEVRWSDLPIDADNFAAGTLAAGTPPPAASGQAQSFELAGLQPGRTYYVALKSKDEWGNTSELSNVTSGETLPPPTFSSSPSSFAADLLTGGSATRVLTLSNVGVGTLDWRIANPSEAGYPWLAAAPRVGRLGAGEQAEITLTVDATGLDGGVYTGSIDVSTNDPERPLVGHPFTLTVTGAPDIALLGSEIVVTSSRTYSVDGAVTTHTLPVAVPPAAGGSIELTADGDYGDYSETATATAEGRQVGTVGAVGNDCSAARGSFAIGMADLAALAADGQVNVRVENSAAVNVFCSANAHTVSLRYRGPADAVDFGGLFVGASRSIEITVANRGTATLAVSAISADQPEFSASESTMSVPPREVRALQVTFTPSRAEAFAATLTILSDDPDAPAKTVSLTGTGLEPPVIGVAPSSLQSTLNEGAEETQSLVVSNTGGSPLVFSIIPGVGGGAADSGTFQSLGSSPVPLTCVVADDAAGFLYAQANFGYTFHRYSADADTWEGLAPSPIYSGNNGGAALLNGRVYTVYTETSQMGVYDIAANAWSTMPSPLGAGTANITSDGTRFLYLAAGFSFVRFDPMSGAVDTLAAPPFAFQPWGALAWFAGSIYGHEGNGTTGFGSYDTSSNAWVVLPDVPSPGAVAGAAIDPFTGEYFAVGSYGGNSLYRYDPAGAAWRIESIPYFPVYDAGLAWLSSPVAGVVVVQGENGTGFARFTRDAGGVSTQPRSGTVAPGASASIDVRFDARRLSPGTYDSSLRIRSNDPVTPDLDVPTTLTVIGRPNIVIAGEPTTVESILEFTGYAAVTRHTLGIADVPAGGATLELVADGDFGSSYETATAQAEGLFVGTVGGTGFDCTPASGTFAIGPDDFARLAADGTVRVDVQNSYDVDLFCAPNRHTVRLSWRRRGDRIEFGPVFVGGSRSRSLSIRNSGSLTLHVTSIASDDASVVASLSSVDVPPHGEVSLEVTYAPSSATPLHGTLTILSDDPDEGTVSLPLSGEGLIAPDIVTAPESFTESLLSGQAVIRVLAIDNVGGSDLTWSGATIAGVSLHRESSAAGGDRALLVQDSAPWGVTSNETVLAANGIAYDKIPSSQLATTPLSSYRLVIIASEQSSSFYAALAANKSRIDAYVQAGGRLEFHGASYYGAAATFVLPGGMTTFPRASQNNYVQLPAHPLVAGVSSPIYGNSASHSAFDHVPTGTQVVATNDAGEATLVQYRVGLGTVIASGQTLEYYYYYGGSVGTILSNMIPYTWGLTSAWLRLEPISGTVPPGGHGEIAVTIDAAGLFGGDYDAGISVTSNDPDEPNIATPVHLHVTGASDIAVEPSILDFGTVFTGYAATRELTIRNEGTDVLHVGPIAIDEASYTVSATEFEVAIGETVKLTLSFGPGTAGSHDGTLTLPTNDPDEANVVVPLTGIGLVPPDIEVSPSEIHDAILRDQIVTRTVTLSNLGGSDLTWSLRILRSAAAVETPATAPPAASASISTATAPAGYRAVASEERLTAGNRVLIVQDSAPWGSTANQRILQANGLGYDVVSTYALATIDLSPYRLVIASSDQSTSSYQRIAAQMGRLSQYVAAGGVLEFHAAGWGWSAGDASLVTLPGGVRIQQSLSLTNYVIDPTHPITEGVPPSFTGHFASHAYFTSVPSGAGVLVADDAQNPNLIEYAYGAGLVVASGQTLEISYDNRWNGRRILENLIAYAYEPAPRWLTATPASGTVPAGASVPLTLTLDGTGLYPGDYAGTVAVTSNDPDERTTTVPVTLHVIGVPDIAVTPPSLEFGIVFLTYPKGLTLHVANAGTEPLIVSSIAAADPSVTVDATSFTIVPGSSRDVVVTMSPAASGPIATSLTIVSDDPDEGSVTVPVSGDARVAPDIQASPDSFSESLLTGQVVTRILAIDNTGGSDLTWEATQAEAAPALHLPGATNSRRALLVQDSAPWGNSSNEQVLAANGIAYDVMGSSQFSSTALSSYALVILASEQSPSYYSNLAAAKDKIDAFVRDGGCLEVHASSYPGYASYVVLPGGMTTIPQTSISNTVLLPAHPLVAGVPPVFSGYYPSHSAFDHLPVGARVVTTNDYGRATLVEYRFGAGTVIASGQTLEYYHAYGGPVGTILDNMIPYSWSHAFVWLRFEPQSGTVPAGGRAEIAVTIDAGGLFGGDYDAAINVMSNDPDESTVSAPVHLHVTGVPDVAIDPASLDFGSVFTGLSVTRTLTIRNEGTDVLHVDPMTIDDSAYSVSSMAFDLPIGAYATVTVTFAPSVAGAHDATLTIPTNDPDESRVAMPLRGIALIPPDIDVAPRELNEVTVPDQLVTRTLTLSNLGGSDLTWGIRAQTGAAAAAPSADSVTRPSGLPPSASPTVPPDGYMAVLGQPLIAAGSRVLIVQDYAPWYTTSNERILRSRGLLFDRVGSSALATIDLSPYRLVIVSSDQATWSYQRIAAQMGRLSEWVAAGGVLEFHAAAGGWNGGDASVVTLPRGMRIEHGVADVNRIVQPAHPIVAGVADPIVVGSASLSVFASVPVGAQMIATDGIGRATLVEYPYGGGLVVASGQTLEYYYEYTGGAAVGRILGNMIPYTCAPGPAWLQATPPSGTIPAGTSAPVSVTFDSTGLQPGDFAATLTVSSNDPDEPNMLVPVTLHVRGVPDIVVTPSELSFETVFVGYPRSLTVRVANRGSEALRVSSIVAGDPAVSVDAQSFTVGVGGHRDVVVTFSPTSALTLQTTLTIESDDPDSGQVGITLTGIGLVPPEVAIDPPEPEATVLRGETAVRTVTVRNTGGSDLVWSLRVDTTASAVPPSSTMTTPGTGSRVAPVPDIRTESSLPRSSANVRVLIVQDNLPWASNATQRILAANSLPFDTVSTLQLPLIDLTNYSLVIVSSDQATNTYSRIRADMPHIAAYVAGGGVLEFHAAGWGWYGGDPSSVILPGGMGIAVRFAYVNHVVQPGHPTVAGLPEPFIGAPASHAYFVNVPPGAATIAANDIDQPDLVAYNHGLGLVVASGHPLEVAYDYRAPAGMILSNMIPWAAGQSKTWTVIPVPSGTIPAGESADIEVEFMSEFLEPGDHAQALVLATNDPDEPSLRVTARLHVLRLRADAGSDQRLECSGGGGAQVVFDGSASAHMDGPGAITRYSWWEQDHPLGEGASFAAPLSLGFHEIELIIEDDSGAAGDDITRVDIVDTVPPSGTITSPAPGACLGPAVLPVAVSDSFADVCGAGLVRVYDPPGGASVSTHGDHAVTLTVSDTSGNVGISAAVSFTVDTVPPAVAIVADPATFQLPQIVPFSSLFTSGDDDGASGSVVHESVAVDGCVVYDGFSYGDRDGLLGDEAVSNGDMALCDIARACGRRRWTNPVVTVTAADCGGNATTVSIVAAGEYLASQCAPATTLAVTSQAGLASLSWSPVPGAGSYQVVRGSLDVLRSTAGQFHLAVDACLAAAAPTSPVNDGAIPPAGTGFWYVVRDVTEGVRGSWDEMGSHQAGPRDAGIDAAAAACP